MGLSQLGRLLVVAHTDRGDRTRIISARIATRQEQRFYEEGN
ncbi:BrnT family toxin [Trichocoleus sp. FACHB-591]|nr:BrnT family toxin [Trichocoleus sp. FACHB-591]